MRRRIFRPVIGMSMPRKQIASNLSNRSGDLLRHIILYLCSNDAGLKNHWANEIYSFIHDVPKLKGTNRYPSTSFIFDNTYEIWYDSMEPGVQKLFQQEHMKYDVQRIKTAIAVAKEYFLWLSEQLSSSGSVTNQEVRQKLESL